MKKYRFRRAEPKDIPIILDMIRQRITWMDAQGIDGWNHNDYLSVYPEKHFWEILEDLYVLEDKGTGVIFSAGALHPTDDRWNCCEDALYLHHFVSKIGEPGAGKCFLRCAEDYSRSQGKRYLRLDSGENNRSLARYYESQGYFPQGICVDGPYRGILRQKEL